MNDSQVMDIQGKILLHSLRGCVSMPHMRARLNNLGGWFAAALLVAAPLCAATAADLKGARVWAGPDYTRVVLDASGPLQYEITQKNGQVMVDLSGSGVSRSFADPSAQGLLRGMSHARIGDSLQVTAKVDPNAKLKSFVLKPSGSEKGYRLVLDLYPGSGATAAVAERSEERRVGKECRSRWSPYH